MILGYRYSLLPNKRQHAAAKEEKHAALLARLQEPDVRDAVAQALHAHESIREWFDLQPEEMDYKRRKAEAAIARVVGMLTP